MTLVSRDGTEDSRRLLLTRDFLLRHAVQATATPTRRRRGSPVRTRACSDDDAEVESLAGGAGRRGRGGCRSMFPGNVWESLWVVAVDAVLGNQRTVSHAWSRMHETERTPPLCVPTYLGMQMEYAGRGKVVLGESRRWTLLRSDVLVGLQSVWWKTYTIMFSFCSAISSLTLDYKCPADCGYGGRSFICRSLKVLLKETDKIQLSSYDAYRYGPPRCRTRFKVPKRLLQLDMVHHSRVLISIWSQQSSPTRRVPERQRW